MNSVAGLLDDALQDHHNLVPDQILFLTTISYLTMIIYEFFFFKPLCVVQKKFSSAFVATLFGSVGWDLWNRNLFSGVSNVFKEIFSVEFQMFLPLFQKVSCAHPIEWTLLVNLSKVGSVYPHCNTYSWLPV